MRNNRTLLYTFQEWRSLACLQSTSKLVVTTPACPITCQETIITTSLSGLWTPHNITPPSNINSSSQPLCNYIRTRWLTLLTSHDPPSLASLKSPTSKSISPASVMPTCSNTWCLGRLQQTESMNCVCTNRDGSSGCFKSSPSSSAPLLYQYLSKPSRTVKGCTCTYPARSLFKSTNLICLLITITWKMKANTISLRFFLKMSRICKWRRSLYPTNLTRIKFKYLLILVVCVRRLLVEGGTWPQVDLLCMVWTRLTSHLKRRLIRSRQCSLVLGCREIQRPTLAQVSAWQPLEMNSRATQVSQRRRPFLRSLTTLRSL